MKPTPLLRAYLVDDEPLALRRLSRQLSSFEEVAVMGSTTDPAAALEYLSQTPVHVIFLDIQMPEMNGFELLSCLSAPPMVIFTTAYDHYALKAFEVNAIDYLLKPIDRPQLERALQKLRRLRAAADSGPPLQRWMNRDELQHWLGQLAAALRSTSPAYPDRIASRSGDRVRFIEVDRISHFFARDKLTFAVGGGQAYAVDQSINRLERELDPAKFFRIHRSALVNLNFVQEIHSWFGGRVLARLKDERRTELTVARDRVRSFRQRLKF